ncbi:molybdopterin-guanine dinucleotide biosynthesis protein B [Miniphocaeibacter halophilus]|uniref:Molybdopterin-guanine dinucleotide biosynthesis protein B n=2 Tax=Miniphocaeibacter halophilus TaxID=2931922 RepID=A0AC61MTK3_9FIRM|nr:molybdopterin-guanine dinucleotide biosynthesis protein B [Miniphocaeibacter halophilus]
MGENKSELIYKGNTFLENLIHLFKGYDIIVSSNDKDFKKIDKVRYTEDLYKNIGPISGILEILKASKYEYNFITGVDMQNINLDFVNYLKSYISSDYYIFSVKSNNNIHPIGAIYSKKMVPTLEKYIHDENYKLKELLKEPFSKIIDLKYSIFNDNILYNVNTKEEYYKLINNNIISICGRKNSGKTTFIEKLIYILKEKGYKVCAIKHDGHDFNIDNKTDTGKFFNAGADSVAIFSNRKYMMIENKKINIEFLLNRLKEFDLIVIEGLKDSDFDKYEIVRFKNSTEIITRKPLKGIVTDIEDFSNKYENVFKLSDIDNFANYIIEHYISPKQLV